LQIWILPDADGKLVVHYGEFAENLREVSPGLLDRIEVTPRLRSAKGETPLVHADQTSTSEAEFLWKGSYPIQMSHLDPTPGSRGGNSFELTNFVTTLSLVQPTGLEPVASPPAAKPSAGLG
jgi:hypothetical protein